MTLTSLESAADGARLTLMVVFGLAAIEKGVVLQSHSAAWHPIMLASRWRRRHATGLVTVSLAADLSVLMFLAWAPLAGGLIAASLTAAYLAVALGRQDTGIHECQCFWKFLNTSTLAALAARNLMLTLLALFVVTVPPIFSGTGFIWLPLLIILVALVTRLSERDARARHPEGVAELRPLEDQAMAKGREAQRW